MGKLINCDVNIYIVIVKVKVIVNEKYILFSCSYTHIFILHVVAVCVKDCFYSRLTLNNIFMFKMFA